MSSACYKSFKYYYVSKKVLLTAAAVSVGAIVVITTCAVVFGKSSRGSGGHSPGQGYCEVASMTQNSPLLVYAGTTTLIYPNPGSNTTIFSSNEAVDFACPNSLITINYSQFGSSVNAVCKNNQTFIINGTTVLWNDISCPGNVNPTVKQLFAEDLPEDDDFNGCMSIQNTTGISIGFDIDENRHLGFIKICFNDLTKIALYSYYNLTASINNRANVATRPFFRQDDNFYRMGTSINTLFVESNNAINTILGLNASSEEYINSNFYINRGHLAAMADFYYAALQISSFRYVNVAPQWNTFNDGNWNQIEIDVRNYAVNNKINLKIWTGTYEIAQLPDENNNPLNLYLYVNEIDRRNSPAFPIPAVFWKLVYDPANQKAIVLIGHNNPYEEIIPDIRKVCDVDVSDKINWLNWDKENIQKGYCYACEYNNNKLQSTISFIPKIIVKQLLI